MRQKEFRRRVDRLNAVTRRATEEMKYGRRDEAATLVQDEVVPRLRALFKEVQPYMVLDTNLLVEGERKYAEE